MAAPESGTIAVLAEKPSVARDIARVLGATRRGDGYLLESELRTAREHAQIPIVIKWAGDRR